MLSKTSTPEGNIDYSYEEGSKLSRITEGSESLSYEYDGSLVISFSFAGVLNQTITQTYNNDFRVSSMTNAREEMVYDSDNLLYEEIILSGK